MAEDPAVLKARKPIEEVLWTFVHQRAEAKVVVAVDVNEFGHLFAVVATGAFEGMSQRERQKAVWDYLRQKARPEDLAHVYQIYTFTTREYDARVATSIFPGGKTEMLDLGPNAGSGTNG
jgi:acid stress-induced BolA-like protein IbaG/YrbA